MLCGNKQCLGNDKKQRTRSKVTQNSMRDSTKKCVEIKTNRAQQLIIQVNIRNK